MRKLDSSLKSKLVFIKSPITNNEESNSSIGNTVSDILIAVKERGDSALSEFSKKFDKVDIEKFEVTAEECHQRGCSEFCVNPIMLKRGETHVKGIRL